MAENYPVETIVEYEAYNHRILWASFIRLSDLIKVAEKDQYDIEIPAKITIAFAIEALFNWIGDKYYTEYWKNERKNFRSEEYPGVQGKYIWLHEKLIGSKPKMDERPHKTLFDLIAFRNLCAHAKKDVNKEEIKGEHYRFLSGKMYTKNSELEIQECKLDIQKIARALYEKLDKEDIKLHGPDPFLGTREYNLRITSAV